MPIHGWKTLDVLLEGIFEAAPPERDLVHVLCCCVYSASVTAWRVGMAEQFLALTKTLMQMHHRLYMNNSSKLL